MSRKPIILFDSRFLEGTPTATDTATGFSVLNIRDYRTYTFWRAASAGTKYITVDCATAKTADCLAVISHNLNTAAALVSVESSPDNSVWTNRLAEFTPTSNRAFMRLVTSVSARYWRIKIVTASVAPQLAVAMLGTRFEFARYLQAGFDPAPERINARSTKSKAGHLLGTTVDYYELEISAMWENLTASWVASSFMPVWSNIKTCRPFFWAWNIDNYPSDIYYVRIPDDHHLTMPFDPVRRSLRLNMVGVAE